MYHIIVLKLFISFKTQDNGRNFDSKSLPLLNHESSVNKEKQLPKRTVIKQLVFLAREPKKMSMIRSVCK